MSTLRYGEDRATHHIRSSGNQSADVQQNGQGSRGLISSSRRPSPSFLRCSESDRPVTRHGLDQPGIAGFGYHSEGGNGKIGTLKENILSGNNRSRNFGSRHEVFGAGGEHEQYHNQLRRKPSSIAQYAPLADAISTTASKTLYHDDLSSRDTNNTVSRPCAESTPAGAQKKSFREGRNVNIAGLSSTVDRPIVPELDRYRLPETTTVPEHSTANEGPHKLATQGLPPTPRNKSFGGQSPLSGHSGISTYSLSPSSRYFCSPSAGPHSRDTTPSSLTSQSPSTSSFSRSVPRIAAASPRNQPLSFQERKQLATGRRDTETSKNRGSPTVKERSSVIATNISRRSLHIRDKKSVVDPKVLRPPSPPPRKSSSKSKGSFRNMVASPTKLSKTPASSVLNHQPAHKTTRSIEASTAHPQRPSREGTPSVGPQFIESPVIIRSNITYLPQTLEERRGPDLGKLEKKGHSRSSSRALEVTESNQTSSRALLNSSVSDLRRTSNGIGSKLPLLDTKHLRKASASREPSPTSSSSSRLFGLFGRRHKPSVDIPALQRDKIPRKGPAAGTGYEGYGRHVQRGRSSSVQSREAGNGQSVGNSSRESLVNSRPHDSFLLQRTSPVVIAGGGFIVENNNSNTDSFLPRPQAQYQTGPDSRESFQLYTPKTASKSNLLPSPFPSELASKRSSISLAGRKNLYTGKQKSDNLQNGKLSTRKEKTNHLGEAISGSKSPSISQNQQGNVVAQTIGFGQLGNRILRQNSLQELDISNAKRTPSPRKWSFFKRTPKISSASVKSAYPTIIDKALKEAVSHCVLTEKLYDAQEPELNLGMDELSRVTDPIKTPMSIKLRSLSRHAPGPGHSTNGHDPLLELVDDQDEAPFLVIPRHDKASVFEPHVLDATIAVRRTGTQQVQLPYIEEISPLTQSERPEQPRSPNSFSRPFALSSAFQTLPISNPTDRSSIALGLTREQALMEYCHKGCIESSESAETSFHSRVAFPIAPSVLVASQEGGFTGTCDKSVQDITAVIPGVLSPAQADEIWDHEYNDLLSTLNAPHFRVSGVVTSTRSLPPTSRSYQDRVMPDLRPHTSGSTQVVDQWQAPQDPLSADAQLRLALASSGVHSPELAIEMKDTVRTSDLSKTDSISANYFNHSNSKTAHGIDTWLSTTPDYVESQAVDFETRSRHLPSKGTVKLQSPDIPEHINVFERPQVNLRTGALTVSKWLTFGHVLFSPARHSLLIADQPTKSPTILVIDGLESDDWSFYAAETYPNATIYNISSKALLVRANSNQRLPEIPSNHHQIQVSSLIARLNFPRDFFSVVVIRFPSASPNQLFRHLVIEAKRVLKPSGYLELSILDFDMLNMGPKCRRAVRSLKTNIAVSNSSIDLGSASDSLLKEISTRGFADIKSCRVGIPVASIVNISESSGGTSGNHSRKGSESADVSLAELMRDEGEQADQSISKMVAKVGRYWWTKCYERSTLTQSKDTARGIFSDEKLLKECEEWGTSFKMCVCHARKANIGSTSSRARKVSG